MLEAESGAIEAVQLLIPGACANTAAATGGWIDVRKYEGNLVITQQIGVVTGGSIAGKIQDATDGSGTGVADVVGATFTSVSTATDPALEKLLVPAGAVRGWIRYLGTVTTGPCDAGVTLHARPQYV